MIAMLFAAQLTAAVATLGAPPANLVRPDAPPLADMPTPNAYRVPAHCKDAATVRVVDRYGQPLTQKLGDLPPGALQYAVDRSIGGCRVITVIYGTVIPDSPNGSGKGQLTPLTKTPLVAPLMREDAPSNRR